MDYNQLSTSNPQHYSDTAWIPQLVISVLIIVGLWKSFQKAGKPGWAALIPVYQTVVMLNIAGRSGWNILWFVGTLIAGFAISGASHWVSILLPVGLIVALGSLAFPAYWTYIFVKAYGRGLLFFLGALLLPYIFYPILGYGKSKYIGPSDAKTNPNTPAPATPAPQPPAAA